LGGVVPEHQDLIELAKLEQKKQEEIEDAINEEIAKQEALAEEQMQF